MQIRVGYEFIDDLPQSTPMILTVSIHYSRASDTSVTAYRDDFGNWCSRIAASSGPFQINGTGVVGGSGLLDPVVPNAQQYAVKDLPKRGSVIQQKQSPELM